MMSSGISGCGEIRQALGVYVVGAIDPAERSTVDRHLAVCSACRDELAGLAGLPALLGRVTLEEAERGRDAADQVPPARLLDSLLAQVARQQAARRRRTALLAVAACVAVLAGGGAGVAALVSGTVSTPRHHASAAAHWTTVSGRDALTKVSASVRYRPMSWGTDMAVWVSGVRYGTKCQLWVVDSSGRRTVAGGWDVPKGDQAIWYPASAAVAPDTIRDFQITAHGKTLVTLVS